MALNRFKFLRTCLYAIMPFANSPQMEPFYDRMSVKAVMKRHQQKQAKSRIVGAETVVRES